MVPPEHVGAGETDIAFLAGFPDLLAADEPIGLTPQQDFHLVAEQPAISNNAMVLRQRSRHESGLNAAGDGGGHRRQFCRAAITSQPRKPRGPRPQKPW